ncbi:MAG: hypothetical protein ACYSUT_06265 [Planctomycetota bacterium]|jgi:hypothetical protein
MKSRNKILVTITSIFIILSFSGVLFFSYVEPLVKQNQLHSDLMFLDNIARTCINEYYESNYKYPESLSQIVNRIIESCHADSLEDSKYRELLSTFQVISDKKQLILSWKIEKKDVVYHYTTVFENGQGVTTLSKSGKE